MCISTSAKRKKKPVKVQYLGYGYSCWVSIKMLKCKALQPMWVRGASEERNEVDEEDMSVHYDADGTPWIQTSGTGVATDLREEEDVAEDLPVVEKGVEGEVAVAAEDGCSQRTPGSDRIWSRPPSDSRTRATVVTSTLCCSVFCRTRCYDNICKTFANILLRIRGWLNFSVFAVHSERGRLMDDAKRRGASRCSLCGSPAAPQQAHRAVPTVSEEFAFGRQADPHEAFMMLTAGWLAGCVKVGDGSGTDCSKLGYSEKEQLEASSMIGHVFGGIMGSLVRCKSCTYDSLVSRVASA
eukprot:symbB.v1.2.041160.t1/scaffold7881.1/size8887/1